MKLEVYEKLQGDLFKTIDDNINPSHYKNGPNNKEVFYIMIDIWGKEKVIYYCEMNAFKYRMRAGKKSSLITEDIEKALWYENKIKELYNG